MSTLCLNMIVKDEAHVIRRRCDLDLHADEKRRCPGSYLQSDLRRPILLIKRFHYFYRWGLADRPGWLNRGHLLGRGKPFHCLVEVQLTTE